MKRAGCVAAVLILVGTQEAAAQFRNAAMFTRPPAPAPVPVRGHAPFIQVAPQIAPAGWVGGFGPGCGFVPPCGPGFGFGPFAGPGFGCGPFGCGPFGGTFGYSSITVFAPPPVIVPAPIVVPVPQFVGAEPDEDDRFLRIVPRRRRQDDLPLPPPPQMPADPPLPGDNAGRFRPITPDDRDKALRPARPPEEWPAPPPPERPRPPEKPAERPPIVAEPPAKGEPFNPWHTPTKPDAKADAAIRVELGRKAFAEGAFGRAVDRFKQAVDLQPEEARWHFLLAQARFAAGRYRDAVASLTTALKLRPELPRDDLPPRGLYGKKAADFDAHLAALRASLVESPDDPALLFLLGAELWFDGQRGEALLQFQKARPRVTDPTPVDRFLEALGGADAVARRQPTPPVTPVARRPGQ